MCPGNHRSAGQTQGSKTTQGKRWLRGALTECAWGVSAQKNCFLKEKFWRLATKKQRQPPATRALAHTLWVLGYQVLKSGQPDQERGQPVMDETQRNRLICHHVRRLGKLGIRVRSLPVPKESRKRKPNKTALKVIDCPAADENFRKAIPILNSSRTSGAQLVPRSSMRARLQRGQELNHIHELLLRHGIHEVIGHHGNPAAAPQS